MNSEQYAKNFTALSRTVSDSSKKPNLGRRGLNEVRTYFVSQMRRCPPSILFSSLSDSPVNSEQSAKNFVSLSRTVFDLSKKTLLETNEGRRVWAKAALAPMYVREKWGVTENAQGIENFQV